MMAEKARLFADDEALEEILTAATPGEAKALGRRVRNFDNPTWEAHRSDIVTRASVGKFGSNDELRSYLGRLSWLSHRSGVAASRPWPR